MILKEDKLINLFSRVHLSEAETFQAEELLSCPLRWDYILEESQNKVVASLVYYHLHKFKFNCPDKQSFEQLKSLYYRNSALNMMIIEEVKKLLNVFNDEKIKVILLKGFFFLENIYKNIALRPITDVDILVKKEDLFKTGSILESFGFIMPANFKNALAYRHPSSMNSFYCKRKRFTLHLHWHLINSSWPLDSLVKKIEMGKIWSNAKPINIDGVNALALSGLVYVDMQEGFWGKLKFIARIIFPSTYVMADNCALPTSKITAVHYCQRLIRGFPGYFRFN